VAGLDTELRIEAAFQECSINGGVKWHRLCSRDCSKTVAVGPCPKTALAQSTPPLSHFVEATPRLRLDGPADCSFASSAARPRVASGGLQLRLVSGARPRLFSTGLQLRLVSGSTAATLRRIAALRRLRLGRGYSPAPQSRQ
jgi:hypothetical protein